VTRLKTALEGNKKSDNQEKELDRAAYEVDCVRRVPSLGAKAGA
jgi:hypothetical protein